MGVPAAALAAAAVAAVAAAPAAPAEVAPLPAPGPPGAPAVVPVPVAAAAATTATAAARSRPCRRRRRLRGRRWAHRGGDALRRRRALGGSDARGGSVGGGAAARQLAGRHNKVARTLAKRTFGDIMHALPSMADDDSDALKKQVDQLHFLMLGQLDATHDLDAERLAVSESGKDAADAALARVFARA